MCGGVEDCHGLVVTVGTNRKAQVALIGTLLADNMCFGETFVDEIDKQLSEDGTAMNLLE